MRELRAVMLRCVLVRYCPDTLAFGFAYQVRWRSCASGLCSGARRLGVSYGWYRRYQTVRGSLAALGGCAKARDCVHCIEVRAGCLPSVRTDPAWEWLSAAVVRCSHADHGYFCSIGDIYTPRGLCKSLSRTRTLRRPRAARTSRQAHADTMWPFSSAYPETPVERLFDEYDYIIVGGGTAGCVLARRLADAPATAAGRVLLVERGPVADTWASRVPLFSSDFASDGTRTIRRPFVRQSALAEVSEGVARGDGEKGRTIEGYSGAVLGGTSRINQMLYVRGWPEEYESWRKAGLEGWGWEDMKRCFLKSEKAEVAVEGVHNTGGLWKHTTHTDFYFKGFGEAVEAAKTVGFPYIPDVNAISSDAPFGCAKLHFTIDEHSHRHSAYHAFIPADYVRAKTRVGRLHVCTGTIVERLVTERTEDGKLVVTGVVLGPTVEGAGKKKIVGVKKEVVLSAGPFGSPQILMLSGIGPAEHLKEHSIPVIQDLPAVGSNLQDHFGVSVGFNIKTWDSLISLEKWPWRFFIELGRYLIWGTGLLLVPVLQLAIFANSKLLDERGLPTKTDKASEEKLPDIEVMPMAYDSTDPLYSGPRIPANSGTFSFLNVLLAPQSRGTVRLSAADARAPLAIDPAFLSNPADLLPLRAAVRLSLRLRDAMRARGYAMRDATVPEGETDAEVDDWIRTANRTTYHYSSTCRMGRRDDGAWEGGAVVDARLRVYGVGRLRVADSSVFPWVPRTHTQAPAAAVGERCAELILEGGL
ncbi:hypothetical protein BD413DRAFT_523221 [Trametes elegans]|nr:hypothetical protein BD413DRAFT_523221 [Trametes elegans]